MYGKYGETHGLPTMNPSRSSPSTFSRNYLVAPNWFPTAKKKLRDFPRCLSAPERSLRDLEEAGPSLRAGDVLVDLARSARARRPRVDYRLGAPNEDGEWAIIDPTRPRGERIVGRAVLPILDTGIIGIEPGERYELGDPEVTWSRDPRPEDAGRWDDDPDGPHDPYR
jgi:hypothetical protein